MNGETAGASA